MLCSKILLHDRPKTSLYLNLENFSLQKYKTKYKSLLFSITYFLVMSPLIEKSTCRSQKHTLQCNVLLRNSTVINHILQSYAIVLFKFNFIFSFQQKCNNSQWIAAWLGIAGLWNSELQHTVLNFQFWEPLREHWFHI